MKAGNDKFYEKKRGNFRDECSHGGKHKWVAVYRGYFDNGPKQQKCQKCGQIETVMT